MKVALVHDYLKEAGGAERVLRVLSEMYPEAPIYTSFVFRRSRVAEIFSDRTIIESRWGRLLKIGKMYSYLRFLQPLIWKSLDLTEYDLVITSCSGYIARGFRVKQSARVVAYCHTPPKWLYGYETPTKANNKWWGKLYLCLFGPFVRYFDYHSAQRVNSWIANSKEVARRIKKYYRKESKVVYPPIQMNYESRIKNYGKRTDYYLVVGRLVGAKGVEMAIAACKRMKRRLVIVGEGAKAIEGAEYTGWVSDERLAELYAGATGYLALARDEDFGMTVVESIISGTPVVALSSGGYKETVNNNTGVLVEEMTVEGVVAGMKKLEKSKWDRKKMKKLKTKYGRERFEKEVLSFVREERIDLAA